MRLRRLFGAGSKVKVFGIGFHKTGTTSLAEALRVLGYRVTGPNGVTDPRIAERALPLALRLARRYDGFQDNPWPILYRELDERFPGSKFVLTTRPTPAWIKSQVQHFGETDTPMRQWIYGVGHPLGHEDVYVRRYEAHNRAVMEHFRDRPDDLLVLKITEGEGWEKLCPFLGHEVPQCTFPSLNRASDRGATTSG